MPHLLCLGYGYTARTIAQVLTTPNSIHGKTHEWKVSGTTRNRDKMAGIAQAGITPVFWDSTRIDGGDALAIMDNVTHVLVSSPPGNEGCPAHALLANRLHQAKSLQWVGYLSSNGVYGDHQGGWVDETTPTNPGSDRAKRRIRAEKNWREFTQNAPSLASIIFRLPGIYGPGRSAINSVRNGTAKRIIKPGQVFSRMHVDDIASAIIAGMSVQTDYCLFNLCDDEAAPPQDVITYACELLGVAPPPEISFNDATLSDMARSFYADNKRVSNARMKKTLSVALKYPTYREGLRAILNQEAPA